MPFTIRRFPTGDTSGSIELRISTNGRVSWRDVAIKTGSVRGQISGAVSNAICSYSTAGMRCGRTTVVTLLPLTYHPRTNPSEQETEGGRMFYHEI
jgi:hypothetical protein